MKELDRNVQTLDLLGGRLCLDFANTVDWHASEHPIDYMNNYSDLIEWSGRVGIIKPVDRALLLEVAHERPEEAATVAEEARELREALYRIFASVAHHSHSADADLKLLNVEVKRTFANLELVREGDGFQWEWTHKDERLDQVLWPIVRSAAELLTSPALARVKQCADSTDGCGWLFLDTSRNNSRRWCDMKDCGNRAKARQYLKRQRAAA